MTKFLSFIVLLISILLAYYGYINYNVNKEKGPEIQINLTPQGIKIKNTQEKETKFDIDGDDQISGKEAQKEDLKESKIDDGEKYIAKIMGGEEISIKDIPYQVGVALKNNIFCGGSIIKENVVLTAAHCTDGLQPSDFVIKAGVTRRDHNHQTAFVKKIIQHENFSKPSRGALDYDISLLILTSKLKFDQKVNSVPLPRRNQHFSAGIEAAVSGWGVTNIYEEPSKVLRRVFIPIISQEECKKFHGSKLITDRVMCAGSHGKDACAGDSGGPLVVDGILVGIVSFGPKCNEKKQFSSPGVWARVAYFVPWIEEHLSNI